MIKILIADDEAFIRKGIGVILERDLEEEVYCLEASNGLEAVGLVGKETPDLIITDISMPGCDGLEFISQLKEQNHKSEVIIVSGYENFEYAKKAMKLGVKDYIMKPIKKLEFLSLVQEYIHQIKKNRSDVKEECQEKMQKDFAFAEVRKEALLSLIECENTNQAALAIEKLGNVGIRFQHALFICALAEYEVDKHNREYIDFAAKNILDECLSEKKEYFGFYTVEYELGKMLILLEGIHPVDFFEEHVYYLKEAAELIQKFGKTKVHIGVGDIAYDVKYLHNSFRHAKVSANYKVFQTGTLTCYKDVSDQGKEQEVNMKAILKEANGNQTAVLNAFEKILEEPPSKKSLRTLMMMYQELLVQTMSGKKDFNQIFSKRDLKKEIRDVVGQYENCSQSLEKDSGSVLMKELLYYIDTHITEELDLTLVADHFDKAPGYISTIFSKTTGSGFNEYITNERIQIAKELLSSNAVPIRQIGTMCGYPNAKYFSVVFKKVTGMTPKQYRNTTRTW